MKEASNEILSHLPEILRSRVRDRIAAWRQATGSGSSGVPEDQNFMAEMAHVFALSEFVARNCIRRPDLLRDLRERSDLERSCAPGEYSHRVKAVFDGSGDETAILAGLRRLRNRELVRIAWRDLTGRADLIETMGDMSAFADACLKHSVHFLHPRLCELHGEPVSADGKSQGLVILGLGKLGGNELNFSSDIDLMFAFAEAGSTAGGKTSISNEEFFSRLARRLIDLLGKMTIDGFVFRVDTRLRPYGDAGPLVMSFDAMENYYQMFGRGWERYALIKARSVAGDIQAGHDLLERLRPFVFRRYLDYGTFDSLREMKKKIEQEVIRKRLKDNIKQGYGGIREIEFFGQIFQLIRGGIDPRYQERNLLAVLRLMAADRCITRQVQEELTSAYIFLRNTEHRLQMYDDMQTHTLPGDEAGQARLAHGMGFAGWSSFQEPLHSHMELVNFHFHGLLSPGAPDRESGEDGRIGSIWQNPEDREQNHQILTDAGFTRVEEILFQLDHLRETAGADAIETSARERLDRLMPLLLNHAASTDRPAVVIRRLVPLVESIIRRSCYISLLLENPGALKHLVRLARISPWIISFLCSHPLLLDELLDARSLEAPLDRAALAEDLRNRLEQAPEGDIELQMDAVRVFKQINTFRIVAADISGNLPLMRVSDRLTWLAETVLDAALKISWENMTDRYGRPSHLADAPEGQMGFAVVAYGKLGGIELGYASDLDLVFLHTAEGGETLGGRFKPLYSTEFYSRLAQRIIHFLTAATSTGKLYETDMRLRPSGNAGVLVSLIDAFADYQAREAWIWEHQALIKSRAINGDAVVMRRFEEIRERVITTKRNAAQLRQAVTEMREKMRHSHPRETAGRFDLKQDPGGIIDIEFLVQYLILNQAHAHPELVRWTDVVRQLNALALSGIIDDITAHSLKQAYLIYRYFVHRANLQEKPAVLPDRRFRELRRRVKKIWNRFLVPSGN